MNTALLLITIFASLFIFFTFGNWMVNWTLDHKKWWAFPLYMSTMVPLGIGVTVFFIYFLVLIVEVNGGFK